MKSRPALTVLASNHLDYKRGGDGDDDKFEASCDIGETTLQKAGLRINSSGVTFADDKSLYQKDEEELGECVMGSQSTRKLVALDKLEICSMIGRGSSGQVFKARHCESNTLYAVKVVTNVFDKPRRDQLLTEIRTLYGIESEHLVGFYGAYFQDHALSIVLEFCALGSLDQLLAKLPKRDEVVPENVVAAIAMQVLMGLAHLKRVRHVHRDIKPQNILVQQDGSVKLTDFGLARELGSSISMAQTFVGTFKYMAPERVQNEPYDYKSDIWSLGLVLIECATRAFPYANARSYIDVVQSIVESPEPHLPEVDANGKSFTPEFHEFIRRCLKKEPSKRASVDELLKLPWLQLHNATSTDRSVRRCVAWLQQLHLVGENASEAKECSHEHYHHAKDLKSKLLDEDEDVGETIED
ncbi:STE/STE7 protein kinase [Phytophthora megakarya]|uniref:mitogen-activated protein kinase kinase n=1 Tax=Phytophthora megakarya TaxID=4795 RepID=A0A225W5J3_9STRA|nr:STE/STE7 protein kinase [Phytophthora megakarya]